MQSKKASPSKPPATEVKPHSNHEPVASTSRQPDTETVYDVSTDDDDDAGNQLDEDGLPVLPNFFGGRTFLLSGKFSNRRTLSRYVIAYNGYESLLSASLLVTLMFILCCHCTVVYECSMQVHYCLCARLLKEIVDRLVGCWFRRLLSAMSISIVYLQVTMCVLAVGLYGAETWTLLKEDS